MSSSTLVVFFINCLSLGGAYEEQFKLTKGSCMNWQPTMTWQHAQQRAKILQKIRQFFIDRNVLEVETPTLSKGTVTDVHLESLSCRYNYLSDSPTSEFTDFYLQTSPEFHMKRLLASGYGSIFQIAKAFRHEEAGKYHNPEFTMLEWYRLGFDPFELMAEVTELLKTILSCSEPLQVTYQSLFLKTVNIDPLTSTRDEMLALLDQKDLLSDWLVDDSINNADILLQFIFTEIIEPTIGVDAPCFVYNFPKSQASLAQICSDDYRVAQRFECYYKGIELVNGFNELTEPLTQLARFKADNANRLSKGLKEKLIDDAFIAALSEGLPKCSGVALGIDRLVMLALNIEQIEDIISFPIDRA